MVYIELGLIVLGLWFICTALNGIRLALFALAKVLEERLDTEPRAFGERLGG